LKRDLTQHLHIASDYEGDGGVGNIGISIQEQEESNMAIMGLAISANR
jgi:hypothetical protein